MTRSRKYRLGTLFVAALTLGSGPQLAVAQSKAGDPMRSRFGAEWCETLKADEVTLRSIIKTTPANQSATVIESFGRMLVAQEKETRQCCSDLERCRRDFESPPAGPAPKGASDAERLRMEMQARLSTNAQTGGSFPVATDSEKVIELARYAVSAQAAATGTELKLSSIQDAHGTLVAGMSYSLLLIVLKDGKEEAARASVWEKLDGTYQTRWTWEKDDVRRRFHEAQTKPRSQ